MTRRRPWSPDETAVLRAAYPDTPTPELAASLGRSLRATYYKADAMGMKKSQAYLAGPHARRMRRGDRIGQDTEFRKGGAPWNKGMKGFRPGGRSAETQFKPGRPASQARNYRPIGALRISKDGILERKTTDDPSLYPAKRWRPVHVLVWQEHHGDMPKGHIVAFKPGLHTHVEDEITIDRLECITRRENMARNSWHNYPAEIAGLVQLRGAITRQINKRSRS